jgi:RNA methyltransferase, TrmH family
VEGIHPVAEVAAAGWQIDTILYSPELLTSEFAGGLLAGRDPEPQPVAVGVMESLTDKDNPQGILAIVHQKHRRLSDLPAINTAVAMVTPQDPGNVGTILRTADAVGLEAVMLIDGGVDPYHPTCVRASMGTLSWIPWVECTFSELVAWAEKAEVQLIGTSAHASKDYRDLVPVRPWSLILGSEQKGLQEEHLKACSDVIALPMKGRASSLNLAVAAGILMYQFFL